LINNTRRVFLLTAFLILSPALTRADVLSASVTGVVDGNVVTVRLKDGSQHPVRLKGVAAPDLRECFGSKTRSWLNELILDKKITLETSGQDEHQLTLATILLGGKNINLEIIRDGFARYYNEHERFLSEKERRDYQSAEAEARRSGIGLWASGAAGPPCESTDSPEPGLQMFGMSHTAGRSVNFIGRVVQVSEGNSIDVMTDGSSRRAVCVNNLEAPEIGQPYAAAATQHLKDLLLGKDVTVFFRGFYEEDTDCVIGDVYLGPVNVTLQMVRDGVSWSNKSYSYPEGYYVYEQAERAARNELRGIWRDTSPTPPWVYRDQHPPDTGDSASSETGYGSSRPRNADGRVHVRAYTRRDGTYVHSYTRSYPTRRN
jgi:endonuclease YncB( thermonuclease family)